MVAAMQTLKRYNTDVNNYVKCLEFEAKQNRLSRDEQARQHNAAIDGLQADRGEIQRAGAGVQSEEQLSGSGRDMKFLGQTAAVAEAAAARGGAARAVRPARGLLSRRTPTRPCSRRNLELAGARYTRALDDFLFEVIRHRASPTCS